MARFGVIRYPTYYVVIDRAQPVPDGEGRIVYESRSQDAAHRKAGELEKAWKAERAAQEDTRDEVRYPEWTERDPVTKEIP